DYVSTQLNGAHDRIRVSPVSFFVCFAQVSPDANRRQLQILNRSKMTICNQIVETIAIAYSPLGRSAALDWHCRRKSPNSSFDLMNLKTIRARVASRKQSIKRSLM